MSDELELMAELERQNAVDVIKLHNELRSPAEIERKVGVPARKQREILKTWQSLLTDPRYIEERSKQLLGEIDEGYKNIMKRMEEVIDSADEQDDYKAKMNALNSLADIRKKAAEVFLKAGIISRESVGDDIAEAEAKIAAVQNMLLELTDEFPMIKKRVREKLMELEGKTVPTKVVGEDL